MKLGNLSTLVLTCSMILRAVVSAAQQSAGSASQRQVAYLKPSNPGAFESTIGWRRVATTRPAFCWISLWCVMSASWAHANPGASTSPRTAPVFACHPDNCIDSEDLLQRDGGALGGFNWKGALSQSGLVLVTQHSLRMVQAKTRKHLGGPFWRDYRKSVAGLHGWDDGNPVITNYSGHPMMGAVTGFIQIQNDPAGIALRWNPRNPAYWRSRLKALGWAAVYSTSFELAPWGEAGIGNVGYDPGTMAYVDLVVTPLGGFGMILLEDYLDRKIIERLEQGKSARQLRIVRVLLNPQRGIANLLRFERPSHRDSRPVPDR